MELNLQEKSVTTQCISFVGLQQELDGKTEHLEQLSNLLLLDSDQTSIRRFVCAFPHVSKTTTYAAERPLLTHSHDVT
jgi:hypothetical protein